MGKRWQHKPAGYYATLLLTIFLAYLCSNTLFNHYHLLNGDVITHSHIYTGTPDKPEHDHSQDDLQLIAYLADFTALASPAVGFSLAPILFICGIVANGYTHATNPDIAFSRLRAPPIMM